jgi:transcriptional regulator with XRE-family HTH domain
MSELLGRRLRALRRLKRLTQKDLAGLLGISVSSLSTLERGDKYPRVDMLKKIARILDVSLEELFVLPDSLSQRKHSS